MIIIKRNEKDSIDRMLKRYKQKLKKTKQIRQLKDNKYYIKKSETKRLKKQKAIYIQGLRDEEQKNS